jgi:hypothetical protein
MPGDTVIGDFRDTQPNDDGLASGLTMFKGTGPSLQLGGSLSSSGWQPWWP